MICWLQPASGLSGDMLLGALLDAGADLDVVRQAITDTGLPGWRLEKRRVDVDGIAAVKADVITEDDATHRDASTLIEFVRKAQPAPVAELAERAIRLIAEVEGGIHGKDPADVHLHEIGGHDTVVDTVGVAAALHNLGVTEIYSSPLGIGGHRVKTAHGILPTPAPATSRLLVGVKITGIDVESETVTPTGAALVQAGGTRFDPPPTMTLRAVGYGAGTKRFPKRPNVLQVLLGEPDSDQSAGHEHRSLVVLETNLDDVTGELLGHLVQTATQDGARDAWVTPIVMKKGRPGHTLSVLVSTEDRQSWTEWLLQHTGTLGVRELPVTRTAVERSWETVDVQGHQIRMKRGPWGVKAEHEDVVQAALATHQTWREVTAQAHQAYREHQASPE